MDLDTLLEQAKQKYSKEIEQRRQKERVAYRRNEIATLMNDFIERNMTKLESFNTIYPNLAITLEPSGRVGIEKYSDKDSSGIAWLEWEFRSDDFDIVFYSNTAYPKEDKTRYDVYKWEKDDLSEVPYDATDVEITQAINDALIAMLQNYLDIY